MADEMTTTKTAGADKEDPVADAVEALREAMLERGDDPGSVEALLHSVVPAGQSIVGNFADLQRLGGMMVDQEGGIADAFPAPAPDPDLEGNPAAGGDAAPAEEGGYDTWTKADLTAALDEQGIDYNAGDTKADLIARLEA